MKCEVHEVCMIKKIEKDRGHKTVVTFGFKLYWLHDIKLLDKKTRRQEEKRRLLVAWLPSVYR